MSQLDFLSSVPATYLIDTCCLMNLDGRNRVLAGMPPAALQYSGLEREKIWAGLDDLADKGRLKLIKEVRQELERLHPDALSRLTAYPRTKMPRIGRDLRGRFQAILSAHPELIPDVDLTHDPADPWLVVSAQKFSMVVVTDELRVADRKRPRAKHGPPIPDICDAEGIGCLSLRDLAEHEGWLV